MTVISYKQNNLYSQSKKIKTRKEIGRSRVCSGWRRAISVFNFVCLGCLAGAMAFSCFWAAQSAGQRIDIQNMEKKIISLEESNAYLKSSLSRENNLENWENNFGEKFVRESLPSYFSFKEKISDKQVSVLMGN